MSDQRFAQFAREKYLSVETLRKSGKAVQTPVWFVLHDDVLYLYTRADSGKVKRIRNNPRVRVARCTIRGRVTGHWVSGTASFVEGDERRMADGLLDRKYFLKVLFKWLSRHERAIVRIKPA